MHGVRGAEDLAYRADIEQLLPQHEYLGEMIRTQLLYVPIISREAAARQGRITDWLADGRLERSLGLPAIDPAHDRFMLCGSPAMLSGLRGILDQRGFHAAPSIGVAGDYVFERAFVER